MMCDECGQNPAVFHLAILVGGEKQEKNLCASCMASVKQQFPNVDFAGFAGLLSGFLNAVKQGGALSEEEPVPDIRCSRCGTTYETFQKTGLLGCANCYRDFHEPLEQVLKRIHGQTQHAGRVPGGLAGELSTQLRIDRLRQQLNQAILNEAYEDAAGLRDEIRALTAQKEASAGGGEQQS